MGRKVWVKQQGPWVLRPEKRSILGLRSSWSAARWELEPVFTPTDASPGPGTTLIRTSTAWGEEANSNNAASVIPD